MVLSIIFLEDKHKIVLHLSIFYEYQQFFQHRICFSIQPPDYSDSWPSLARSTSFFLMILLNEATVAIVRKGRSKSIEIMRLMRQLTWCACQNNVTFSAKHVPGVKNNIRDALSRLQIEKFRSLAPQAEKQSCQNQKQTLSGKEYLYNYTRLTIIYAPFRLWRNISNIEQSCILVHVLSIQCL